MMRITEEFLLLLRDEDGAMSRAPEWLVRYALGAAVLMELALENRIDTDARRLFLIDSSPVGDALLDPMLSEIAQTSREHDALYWVEHATRHADEIRETALARLVDNGVLRLNDDRFLRIFGTRHYPLADEEAERDLIRRIRETLLSDTIPEPRDIVIVTLADGCGLIGHILSAEELSGRRGTHRTGAESGADRPGVPQRPGCSRSTRCREARSRLNPLPRREDAPDRQPSCPWERGGVVVSELPGRAAEPVDTGEPVS